MRYPNVGSELLQKWNIKCNNKNNISKVGDFIKSTKTNSPTGYSGATSLPPIGNSFMYSETSSNNHGHERVFVSWERNDIIQISIITFYYNRFSILTNNSKKSMGRFRIQLLLEDKTWSTRYNIPKNDRYSDSSTQWTKLSLNFTEENYGIKLIFDEIDSAHSDMCFSNIIITHSIFYMNYFKDLFESIHHYKKIVLIIFLIQNDKNLLKEIGFSKTDINLLNLEFRNILLEQHEEYLDYVENQEESILEKFLYK